jgi:hypothetical protein
MSVSSFTTNVLIIAQQYQRVVVKGQNYINFFLTVNGKVEPVIVLIPGKTYEFRVVSGSQSFGLFRVNSTGINEKLKYKTESTKLIDHIIKYKAKYTKSAWYGTSTMSKDGNIIKYRGGVILFDDDISDKPDTLYSLIESIDNTEIYSDKKDIIELNEGEGILDIGNTQTSQSHEKFLVQSVKSRGITENPWERITFFIKNFEQEYVESIFKNKITSKDLSKYQSFEKWVLFCVDWICTYNPNKDIDASIVIGSRRAIDNFIDTINSVKEHYGKRYANESKNEKLLDLEFGAFLGKFLFFIHYIKMKKNR